ncbi:flavin reductase family protein [Amycolatopsis solani]|uniref:flavin reductase family protein n=1 Tax=Amycolatopsis solani TaxID=3028615 RepID=UPI0025AFD04F|nr:flavin reductase family protein [Amycolatopsis sp. MEP2-6]
MIDLQSVTSESHLREAFGCFPSGVTAVCALDDGVPRGMAASSFTSVSLSPPLVSICVQRTSSTWPLLRNRPRLGLSVLAEGQDDACLSLSARGGDRFRDVDWEPGPHDSVFISGSSAWLECSPYDEVLAGDHVIALLKIHRLRTAAAPPLVFHGSRFRRLAA